MDRIETRPLPLWDWERFGERDRQGAWCELRDWVRHTLLERMHLDGAIPACWPQHPELVDRLVRFHELEVAVSGGDEQRGWETALRSEAWRWNEDCGCRHLSLGA